MAPIIARPQHAANSAAACMPGGGMSPETLVDVILNHTRAATTPRLVLVSMAVVSIEAVASISLREVAAQVGVSHRNVRKSVRELEELGEVSVLTGENRIGAPNSYRITVRCVPECSGPIHATTGDDVTVVKKKTISRSLRTAVFERDAYRCRACGAWMDLRADHIYPESMGGETTIENLQTLCNRCNTAKGTMLPEEWVLLLAAGEIR